MTTDVDWTAPRPGHWRRDFRFGEWLPGPVSASFETWFLPRCEQAFSDVSKARYSVGLVLPLHVLVNGWYYTNEGKMKGLVGGLVRHPLYFVRWSVAMASIDSKPERGERAMAEPARQRYDQEFLPAFHEQVRLGEEAAGASPVADLPALVDGLADQCGTLMLPLVETLGFAGKAEFALASFYAEHLRPELGGTHQPLLVGLVAARPPSAHAVHSLDWIEPTAGERGEVEGGSGASRPDAAVAERLVAERENAEQRCRDALATRPKLAARFERTLEIAQRYIPLREEMADTYTLPWPVMRRALLRIGDHLVERSVIGAPEDVFHLERAEIEASISGDAGSLHERVTRRRERREQQQALSPPLTIGEPTGIWRKMAGVPARYRVEVTEVSGDAAGPEARRVAGIPTSPGTATGRVCVVRDLDDFDKVQPGDVLVAPVTAPAWTPLFTLVAAVVTDGGSVFAHASVVAREYGIPAVVAAEHATSTFRDGDLVTVDGETGVVSVTG